MLDKNPKGVLNDVFVKLQSEFSNNNPNFVLSSNPFIKLEFLKNLIDYCDHSVIFLDFDLLFSGYVRSEMIKKNINVKVFRGNTKDFEDHIKKIIEIISKDQVLVILDSLNVFNNMFEDLDSFRFINANIMLLSSVAKNTKSQIVVTAIGIKSESEKWILSPGGKQLIDSKNSGIYHLDFSGSDLILNSTNRNLGYGKSYVLKK